MKQNITDSERQKIIISQLLGHANGLVSELICSASPDAKYLIIEYWRFCWRHPETNPRERTE